jgi:hypothetical protein
MLRSRAPMLEVADGVVEGSFSYPQIWQQTNDRVRLVWMGIGDPMTGPVVSLFSFAPGSNFGPGTPRAPAHSHRSDTFRLAVGNQPNQFKDGPRWLGEGDFLLMAANEVYVEQVSPQGAMMVVLFGDRRGIPHGYDQGLNPHDLMVKTWPERSEREFGPGPDHFYPVHQENEDAIAGLATTFSEIPEQRPRLYGSLYDDAQWSTLSDGSTIGAVFMSDPESGPLVLLSNNSPGAAEAPLATYGTDVFRIVMKGQVTVGDRVYIANDFRATEAGVVEGPVVHGPEGSTQVLVFADRRGWLPSAEGSMDADIATRLAEVSAVTGPRTSRSLLVR